MGTGRVEEFGPQGMYAGRRKSAGHPKGDVTVTTIDAAAAWHVGKRKSLAAMAAVLALGLAGCETGTNIFGSSGDTAAQTAVADPAATPGATQSAKIAVASVFGPPDPVAKQLQAQMVAAIEKQRIAVAKLPTDKAEYTLRGYIVSAREKTGTKVSYIWDVTDPAGKRVNRITGEEIVAGAQGKDPWTAVTPQLVDTIVAKSSAPLAAWLPAQNQAAIAQTAPAVGAQAAAAAPATGFPPAPGSPAAALQQPGIPVAAATPAIAPAAAGAPPATGPTTGSIDRTGAVNAMVPSVTGAPGDGGVSLTSAIQRELSRSGLQLTNAASADTYKVEGKVSVGEGKDGKQPITIDWNVKDPAGKKLGTVSQKNEIPQGSLDGAWGKTADAAAAAAAQGIIKLLPQQTAQATAKAN